MICYTYHGTSQNSATDIINNGVDLSKSNGGELCNGFYTGEFLHEAKAWAFQRNNSRVMNVVAFEHRLNHYHLFKKMKIKRIFSRNGIKNKGKFVYYKCKKIGVDIVIAPILGANGHQIKWESVESVNILNKNIKKKII